MKLVESGIAPDLLIEMYATMHLSRLLDERLNLLNRAGKVGFNISGMGHEGAEVGCAFAFKREQDYAFPYYRDLGVMLSWGVTPEEIMLSSFGKAADPGSGGRQMPCHWSNREKNIVTQSSPVGTQVPQAAGLAYAAKLAKDPLVVYCSLGDGTTNQGDFHEGLNFASVHKLPVIYVVYNNHFAISVPEELQYNIKRISERAQAYGIPGETIDGNDIVAAYQATKRAIDRGKAGLGPTLLEFDVVRFMAHSTDDDDRQYRDTSLIETARAKNDPLTLFKEALFAEKILDQKTFETLDTAIKDRINQATEAADKAAFATPESSLNYVYAEGNQ